MIYSYRDLIVWQKSIEMVIGVYKITDSFPKEELYGLTSQMRRAAISIPSNIAEGSRRGSRKDYRHFLLIAYGSGSELETQLEIAKRLDFVSEEEITSAGNLLDEIMRMLNRLIAQLTPEKTTHYSLPTTHS